MIAVPDASAGVEVVLQRPMSGPIQESIGGADSVSAPDLYIAKVANAVWRIGSTSRRDIRADEILEDAIALPDEFVAARELVREAFAFSVQERHPVLTVCTRFSRGGTGLCF